MMTKFDDDTLMAYADGELDPAQRAAIEQAMREDPQVAAAVERHRALRQDVAGAFAGILGEPTVGKNIGNHAVARARTDGAE